jgi:hypothetical protein
MGVEDLILRLRIKENIKLSEKRANSSNIAPKSNLVG